MTTAGDSVALIPAHPCINDLFTMVSLYLHFVGAVIENLNLWFLLHKMFVSFVTDHELNVNVRRIFDRQHIAEGQSVIK